jgi:hypothetical protein
MTPAWPPLDPVYFARLCGTPPRDEAEQTRMVASAARFERLAAAVERRGLFGAVAARRKART